MEGMEGRTASGESFAFLSPEWVHEVAKAVQGARRSDQDFKKLTLGFSLSAVYLVTNIPQELKEQYGGDQAVVFVQLDEGTLRKLHIGTELPLDKVDFTVASDYRVVKGIFAGELNGATCFINRQFKVEPLSKLYQRPNFAAKSIVTGNAILRIARQVPTTFLGEGQLAFSSRGS